MPVGFSADGGNLPSDEFYVGVGSSAAFARTLEANQYGIDTDWYEGAKDVPPADVVFAPIHFWFNYVLTETGLIGENRGRSESSR